MDGESIYFNWRPSNDPSKLNCTRILEWMWHCGSATGYATKVYRYGEAKPCDVSFATFSLCLRLKQMDEKKAKEELDRMFPVMSENHVWKNERARVSACACVCLRE